MSLEFKVLGPIGCRRDGEPVAIGGPQQRRVLAALLADVGRVVPNDRLVDAIWGEDPPDGARRTAMTYVSRLRAALGDGIVETVGAGYRLDLGDDDRFDAARFEQLVTRSRTVPPSQAVSLLDEALSLWDGDAYGEFATEWWALPTATRLEELRLVAIEERVEALLSIGDNARAISDLDGLVTAYPLRERLVGQLMRAYAASGRQAEALRALHIHRDFLAEETGLDPSAELVELGQSIVAGDGRGARDEGGRALRGYVLGDVLGEGAFGTVYRSVQPGIDREVAVKVIRAELAGDPSFVRRFETEAQLVAHLEHPHIVPLYDFWREPGGAYLVFRLLRGGSAEGALAERGTFALDEVSRLLAEIGSALAAAHQVGVVHRDVKPSNILFDETGNSYLVDFGIASEGTASDATPPSAGSPLYAPPEQFHSHNPDPLTDQYSLAAVAYELLCGEPPFQGDSVSTILRTKLEQPTPPLADRRPGLPGRLDAVLQRATASDPAERYPSLVDMLAAWQLAARSGVTTADDLSGESGTSGEIAVPTSEHVAATLAGLSAATANPYIGLRAFGEADVRNFRGRDELADALTEAVTAQGFAAVVGPSGSGKSSLIHAGLVPRLRSRDERIVSMVPGDDPLAQLRLALLAVALREPKGTEVAEMVRSVAGETQSALTIVVDQLEELWTLSSDDGRRSFLAGLAMLATGATSASSPIRVVVGVRADFFDRPLADPDLGSLVGAHTFPVVPMTAAELHDAITGPASSTGVAFEPGLDAEIVADVIDEPASLPLLQFTLAELFARRSGPVITAAAYRDLGGIGGAIGSRAETLYSELSPANALRARLLMLRLVVPGDGTEDTRRRVRRSELPAGAELIVERFEEGRLLVGDHDPNTREPTVEVAHESLLRSWPRLEQWLHEDRDALRAVQHLSAATRSWEEADRADSELYRGGRLEVASELRETRSEQLTPVEREFVDTSVRRASEQVERDRRSRRRLRRLLAGTAVALVVAIVAGVVALGQRQNARDEAAAADAAAADADSAAGDADVARLVSLSQSLAASKRDVAALLALEASRRDPSAATDGALMTALYSDPSFLGDVRTNEDHAAQIAMSPGGRTMWSIPDTAGEQAERIDLGTRHSTPVHIAAEGGNNVHQLRPIDDRLVAVTLDDAQNENVASRVYVFDVIAGETIAEADLGELYPNDIRISPDGTRLAVTTYVRSPAATADVIVYSLPDLTRVASIDQPGPPGERWFPTSAWVDDDLIVTGSPSGRLLLWRPSTSEVVRRLNDPPAPDMEVGQAVGVTSDGSTLITGSFPEGHLMAFDLATGSPRWSDPAVANPPFAIDEPAGVVYAQEQGFGSSRLLGYDLETGQATGRRLDAQHGSACDSAITPDGSLLAVSSCNEGAIALWSLDGATASGPSLGGPGSGSDRGLWSTDGERLIVFDENGRPTVREVRSGKTIPTGTTPTAEDGDVGFFRPNGQFLHVRLALRQIDVYDEDGTVVRRIPVDLPESVGASAANNEAGLMAVAENNSPEGDVTIIEIETGRTVHKLTPDVGAVHGLAISPDGRRLYAAGQAEVAKVFALPSGREVGQIEGFPNVALSPDGRLLAGTQFSGLIRFFDAKTLKPAGEDMSGATAFINFMQFTPDGRKLVTAGLDETMRVWDVQTRRQVGPDIPTEFGGAAIAPDSRQMAVTTANGVHHIAFDRKLLRKAACRSAARELTAAEWRRYVGGPRRDLCPSR